MVQRRLSLSIVLLHDQLPVELPVEAKKEGTLYCTSCSLYSSPSLRTSHWCSFPDRAGMKDTIFEMKTSPRSGTQAVRLRFAISHSSPFYHGLEMVETAWRCIHPRKETPLPSCAIKRAELEESFRADSFSGHSSSRERTEKS